MYIGQHNELYKRCAHIKRLDGSRRSLDKYMSKPVFFVSEQIHYTISKLSNILSTF